MVMGHFDIGWWQKAEGNEVFPLDQPSDSCHTVSSRLMCAHKCVSSCMHDCALCTCEHKGTAHLPSVPGLLGTNSSPQGIARHIGPQPGPSYYGHSWAQMDRCACGATLWCGLVQCTSPTTCRVYTVGRSSSPIKCLAFVYALHKRKHVPKYMFAPVHLPALGVQVRVLGAEVYAQACAENTAFLMPQQTLPAQKPTLLGTQATLCTIHQCAR